MTEQVVDTTSQPLILVVDDDMMIRMLVRETLEQSRFQVEEVEQATDALSVFSSIHPDLVLLDVLMPDIDGFTLCKNMRAISPDTPIVMMTGLDDMDSIKTAYDAGATDFITKPINWPVLSHRMHYIVRASKSFAALRQQEKQLVHAHRIARLGSWVWNTQTHHLKLSDVGLDILQWDNSVEELTYERLLTLVHPLDREEIKEMLKTCYQNHSSCNRDFRLLLPKGIELVLHLDALSVFDENSNSWSFTGTFQDITQRKLNEEKIRNLAYYDPLTKLPNRLLFKEHTERAMIHAQRKKEQLALLFIDVDRFKNINDSLGHSTGDLLLQQMAERLKDAVRRSDCIGRFDLDENLPCVSRLGGDEFTILLENVGQMEHVIKVVQRIMQTVAPSFLLEHHDVFVTVSIGISIYPHDGETWLSLFKNADTAMYHAKELGRNNFQFFTPEMNAATLKRLLLESQMRKALDRNEFVLYFQPQFNIITKKITGMEVLIRWEHPELGLVPPTDFIPLAEETGLIMQIDEWVIRQTCCHLLEWQRQGIPMIKTAINISGANFMQPGFIEIVSHILAETGLPSTYLELELTEGVLMKKVGETVRTLEAIKEQGIHLSVDDFGTGYSSLSYLQQFPLDTLKIDRSFISNVADDTGAQAIAAAIIAIAEKLHLNVIAEGVETEEQCHFLLQNGCVHAQGFLFSRPIKAASIPALLLSIGIQEA